MRGLARLERDNKTSGKRNIEIRAQTPGEVGAVMGYTCQECLQVFAIVERLASASAMNIAGQCHAPMCPFLQLRRSPVVWAWEERPST